MSGPVIIVTGGSKGLGLAVVRILLQHQTARVSTISRSFPAELQDLEGEHGDRYMHMQGDVSKIEDNAALVDRTVQKWGQVNAIMFNAGTLLIGASIARCYCYQCWRALSGSLIAV